MDAKWKHRIAYGITLAIGLIGLWLTIKMAGKSGTVEVTPDNSGAATNPADGTQLGAPTINNIGGNYPLTWITQPQTQPTDNNGVGAATNNLYLPVITNYNATQNGGCDTCGMSAPSAYYASAIAANTLITAAMEKELGYTRDPQNGQVYAPGYYNINNPTGMQIANDYGLFTT
jgi:hypothetical protein